MNRNLLRIAALAAMSTTWACSSANEGPADGGGTDSAMPSSGRSSEAGPDSGPGSAAVDAGTASNLDGATPNPNMADASSGTPAIAGDAGPGTATVNGTLGGQTLTPQSAFAGTASGTADNATFYETIILLTSVANACPLLSGVNAMYGVTGNVAVHDAQSIAFELVAPSPLAAGTFDIVDPNVSTTSPGVVAANYAAMNAACVTVASEQALSGTITIVTATASEITGSYDIVLGTVNADGSVNTAGTDHVTGAFSAPICPAFTSDLNIPNNGGGTDMDAAPVCQ